MFKKMSGLNKKKVLLALVILVLGVIAFILCKDMFYGIDIHGRRLLLKKMVAIYFANIFVYCFTILWDNHLSEKTNSIINFHIMEWYPLVCFVIAESTMGTGSVMVELNLRRILLNTALYMLVFYLVYVISASVRASVIGLTVFTVLFSVANIYLLRFRQIPLIATDFMVARTALNVAKDYDYTPDANILILICYLVGVVLVCRKLQENKDIRKKLSFRIIVAAAYLVFAGGMYNLVMNTDYLEEKYIKFNTFRPIKSYSLNGGLLTFVKSIRLCLVDKPEGYSVKAVDEIAKDYPSDSVAEVEATKQPNIIVIMDEAFANLQDVGSFETNEEVTPFYNSLKENTIKGYTYVSVFGGQTANTEYEFLTGDSKAFLPKGSTPYQLYIKEYMPSLTGNLKLDGYQGMLALHPIVLVFMRSWAFRTLLQWISFMIRVL